MSANSKIEWTDHTFNPWIGCTKVSPACDHCYAEVSTPSRALGVHWGPGQDRRLTSPGNWALPKRWNSEAFFECPLCGLRGSARAMGDEPKACKHLTATPARARVFCASLADVFDNEVPSDWRSHLFPLIDATPNLDWLVLTKRIGNVRKMVPAEWLRPGGWPKNLRLGITICNQPEADRDVAKLIDLGCPNFLSIEPMLSAINLRSLPYGEGEMDSLKPDLWADEIENWRGTSDTWEEDFEDWYGEKPSEVSGQMHARIDWVIVGGESGHQARPMHPDWARSLRDQCAAAGVPFLFKQWGEWIPADQSAAASARYGRAPIREFFHLEDHRMHRIGKKAAGRLLDGRTWDEVPA